MSMNETRTRSPFGVTVAVTAALFAAALGSAATAQALPSGGEDAAGAIAELEAQGYQVHVNGSHRTSWDGCQTTRVHAPELDGDWGTAHVTVHCTTETP